MESHCIIFILAALEFELGALFLLGKSSIACVLPALVILELGSCFVWAGLELQSPNLSLPSS
jgi:hypothetical protein